MINNIKQKRLYKLSAAIILSFFLVSISFFLNVFNVRAQAEDLIKTLVLSQNESGEVSCDGQMTFSVDPEVPGKLIVNCDGQETGGIDVPTPTSTPVGDTETGGLTGRYFNRANLTELMFERIDHTINFDWGRGAPSESMGVNTFSVLWTGFVFAPHSGEYTFYTSTDDGVRLWVNDIETITNWSDHGATENSGTIVLEAGNWYPITIQYYEKRGNAIAKLLWSHSEIQKQIISSEYLAPDDEAPSPSPTPTPTSSTGGTPSGEIFGSVPDAILGNCSTEIHDKYVVIGLDGGTYRTWHPVHDPSGCDFAHEHGDDPATSVLDSSSPAFGYIGKLIGKDEPHAGFKVYVVNSGDNSGAENSIALLSSRLVFHMGTGGPARFTSRFHSMEYKMLMDMGRSFEVSGMADSGDIAGTICANPRHGRTVLGLGCTVDSPYEIWENTLRIRNGNRDVLTAVNSTALFDPITVMDPNDTGRLIHVWDDEADSIFRFNNSRSYFRGCKRHAYHGPAYWYNAGGSDVYYTDAYGNVVENGPLMQKISRDSTDFSDPNSELGFIATYKHGDLNQPMSQFRNNENTSYCTPSIGILN
jgi:hypothetical protein